MDLIDDISRYGALFSYLLNCNIGLTSYGNRRLCLAILQRKLYVDYRQRQLSGSAIESRYGSTPKLHALAKDGLVVTSMAFLIILHPMAKF